MDDAAPLSPEELRGFAVVAEACAEAFLNEPSAQIVDDVARVARALGDGRLDGVVADEALRQRYSERFFVPTGPLYVPLSECSVRGAAEEEGRVRYAPVSGAQADHVLRCYRAVGFDYRALAGFGPAVGSLRPDSLAAELAFMAFWLARPPKRRGRTRRRPSARRSCCASSPASMRTRGCRRPPACWLPATTTSTPARPLWPRMRWGRSGHNGALRSCGSPMLEGADQQARGRRPRACFLFAKLHISCRNTENTANRAHNPCKSRILILDL